MAYHMNYSYFYLGAVRILYNTAKIGENAMNEQKLTNMSPEIVNLRNLIYDLMSGNINIGAYPQFKRLCVEDEYAEGKPCAKLYAEAYELKLDLFDRLNSSDDEEVERMVDCLIEISRITSMKMFDYGWRLTDTMVVEYRNYISTYMLNVPPEKPLS